MVISSRTPDGWPNDCPICGHSILITPSTDTLDAPCPHCGHLLWFGETCLLPVWTSSTSTDKLRSAPIPDTIEIADHVLELLPVSVVRENLIIPIAECADAVLIAAPGPIDLGIIEKLRFMLNRRILAVPTTRSWIATQIDKFYGKTEDTDAA